MSSSVIDRCRGWAVTALLHTSFFCLVCRGGAVFFPSSFAIATDEVQTYILRLKINEVCSRKSRSERAGEKQKKKHRKDTRVS